jgi:transcriptional regulator with XRE-family HTH domain
VTIVPIRENLDTALIREGEQLGDALRQVREAHGLSLRALAERTEPSITGAGISRIERGERVPNANTLIALAGALGGKFEIDGNGLRFTWSGPPEPGS